MSESKGFSHISVSAEEDDDLIIQAGSFDRAPSSEAASPSPEAEAAAYAPSAGEELPQENDDAARARDRARGDASAAEHRPNAEPREKATSETTLEDLQGAKMTGLQKAIVAVAVVAVVGFTVYYGCFM